MDNYQNYWRAENPWNECRPSPDMGGRRFCAILMFVLLIAVAFMFFKSCQRNHFSSSRYGDPPPSQPAQPLQPLQPMKCSVTQGPYPKSENQNTMDGQNYQPLSDWGGLTQTNGKVPSSFVNSESMTGQTYDQAAFVPSEATKEFYDAYNPSKFTSMMPASWRGNDENKKSVETTGNGEAVENNFEEFGRYSVSPMAAQNAESLRGTIRLSELSSTRNARTLGTQSLLREAVTPVGPVPIGSKNYAWGDSSERLAMVAAATGSYPSEIGC